MDLLKKLPRYWKAAVAALAPVFLVVQAAVTDDTVTSTEWVGIVAALVVAAGVLTVPNAPKPAAHVPATDRTPPL